MPCTDQEMWELLCVVSEVVCQSGGHMTPHVTTNGSYGNHGITQQTQVFACKIVGNNFPPSLSLH